jgi:hypothetical protein
MIAEISMATIAYSHCVREVWLSQDFACYVMLLEPTAGLWNLSNSADYATIAVDTLLRILDELDQVLNIESWQAL